MVETGLRRKRERKVLYFGGCRGGGQCGAFYIAF
jgi:hypothetical protein